MFNCANLAVAVQTEDVEMQTEVVELQTGAVLEDVVPPEAVLEDIVQTESVEMQIEVVLDEIPALGRAVGGLLKVIQKKQGA